MPDDDRRYRQRGYQDSGERRSPAARGPQPPRPKPEGPRGRGLGAPSESVFHCAACGAKRAVSTEPAHADFPALDATCAGCGTDLHTCTNCLHFDTGSRWECRRHESLQARIAKKNQRNDCPLYTPKTSQVFGADRDRPAEPARSDPRAAFDALFKI